MTLAFHNARIRALRSTALVGALFAVAGMAGQAQAQSVPSLANAGGATVSTNMSTTVDVNLNGANRIMEWDSFSVGAGSTVNFTSATGSNLVAVNRVTGGTFSDISGTINAANGGNAIDVWLFNPNGVVFNSGSSYTGGSLVLSTLDFADTLDSTFRTNFANATTGGKFMPVTLAGTGSAAITVQNGASIAPTGNFVATGQQINVNSALTASGQVVMAAGTRVVFSNGLGSPLAFMIAAGTNSSSAGVNVNGNVAGQSITLAGGTASNPVASLLNVNTGGSLTALATDGKITLATQSEGTANIVNAQYENPAITANGALTANGTSADLIISAPNSVVAGGTFQIGNDVSIQSNGYTQNGHITAGRDISIASGSVINLSGSLTANRNIVTQSAGNASYSGNISTQGAGYVDLNSGDLLTVSGNISSNSYVSLGSLNRLTIGALNQSPTISAGGSFLIASGASDVINAGNPILQSTCNCLSTITGATGIRLHSTDISATYLSFVSNGFVALQGANHISNIAGTSRADGGLSINNIGNLVLNAPITSSNGDVTIKTSGTLKVNQPVSGFTVALSAGGTFINNSSSPPINAITKWVIYSADPALNTYNGLNSGNTAIWGQTIDTLAPSMVTGNRYVFSYAPTVTFTSQMGDVSKVYGDVLTPSLSYTVTGIHPGIAGVFAADTAATAYSGAPTLDSLGIYATTPVRAQPYQYLLSLGTLENLNGYTISLVNKGSVTVTPRDISGVATIFDKVYDGSALASGTLALNGLLFDDDVSLGGSFSFADKNVGTGKTVALSEAGLTGADAGNYTLTGVSVGTASITAKALTGLANVDNKTYDGTTAASGTLSLTGVVAGDSVSANGSYAFTDKNAGADKAVTISGVILSGADAGNYTLSIPASALASILQKSLTGAVSVDDKTYDGTTSATGSVSLTGVVAGDSVAANGSFAFADKNAGADKAVTISGVTLSGADAGNYTLSIPASALASILQKSLTGAVSVDDKTYDGTTFANGSVSLTGVVAGDSVTANGSYAFADKNAGADKAVTISGVTLSGADAGNYTLNIPASALASIQQRAVSVAISDASKVEGEADPLFSITITDGELIEGDALIGQPQRASGESAGSYAIDAGSLTLGENYALTVTPGALTIAAASVDPVDPVDPVEPDAPEFSVDAAQLLMPQWQPNAKVVTSESLSGGSILWMPKLECLLEGHCE